MFTRTDSKTFGRSKRGLREVYVAVEPFHLDKYVDEQVYRYNNRSTKENPLRTQIVSYMPSRKSVGKRLTYKQLTGKEEGGQAEFSSPWSSKRGPKKKS